MNFRYIISAAGGATAVAIAWLSCGAELGYFHNYESPTSYHFNSTRTTLDGIPVMDVQYEVPDVLIDQGIREVEKCLGELPPLTEDELIRCQCWHAPQKDKVNRDWFGVIVSPEWKWSSSGQEQVYSCRIAPDVCIAKGLIPTPDNPCMCRGSIQDNKYVVTTPNLRLFKAQVVRLVSSCNMVWEMPLVLCAKQ